MRPFLQLSLPLVPSHEEFTALVSPYQRSQNTSGTARESEDAHIVRSLLASADLATKVARKGWEALGRSPSETARCVGCEDGWKAEQKDALRSVIATSIAVAGVKRWVLDGGKPGEKGLRVDVGGKGYHDWWVVPKVVHVSK